jgi:hypothetical protein
MEDLGLHGDIIKIDIQEIVWRRGGRMDWSASGLGQAVGSFERGEEHLGSIK